MEYQASGRSLVQDLHAHTRLPIRAMRTSRHNKRLRAELATPLIESGRVFLPQRARWLDDFLYETSVFPSGLYSDQVDALSQALTFLRSRFDRAIYQRPSIVRFSTGRIRPEETVEPDEWELTEGE
jgi:phage terminase large subunit-like protein